MEITQLRYFQVAATVQHISKAAEMLNISQPALSTTISRLEDELGVSLFDRQGRSIVLNSYGAAFLKRVQRILLDLDDSKKELQDLARLSRQMITLAVTSPQFLQGIELFLNKNPDFKWNLHVNELIDITNLLELGRVDLAITSPGIFGSDFESTLLLRDEFMVAVHPSHPLAAQKSVFLRDIAHEKIIMLEKGLPFRTQTDLLFEDLGLKPNITWECDHYLRRELINNNVGITIASSHAQFRHLYAEGIRFLPIADARRTRDIVMTYKKGHYLPEPALQFMEFLKQHYQGYREKRKLTKP